MCIVCKEGHFYSGRSLCVDAGIFTIMGAGRDALVPLGASLKLNRKKTADSDDMVSERVVLV